MFIGFSYMISLDFGGFQNFTSCLVNWYMMFFENYLCKLACCCMFEWFVTFRKTILRLEETIIFITLGLKSPPDPRAHYLSAKRTE